MIDRQPLALGRGVDYSVVHINYVANQSAVVTALVESSWLQSIGIHRYSFSILTEFN